MKIKARRRFKKDYEKLETRLKGSLRLRKALFRAISMLQQGEDLATEYTLNRIPAQGERWYDCYIYDDIILIYKIEGRYIKLCRLGTAKELEKGR